MEQAMIRELFTLVVLVLFPLDLDRVAVKIDRYEKPGLTYVQCQAEKRWAVEHREGASNVKVQCVMQDNQLHTNLKSDNN
jgi:hypothetical protein